MKLSDLKRTLHQALASGRVGIPVALRWHLRLERTGADSDAELQSAAAALLSWGEQVFGSSPQQVAVSKNQKNALTVLATCAGGQTLHVTVAVAERTETHLLVIGNRGIIRLEGGEFLGAVGAIGTIESIESTVEESDGQKQWTERIRQGRDAGGVLTTGTTSTTGVVP